MCDLDTDTDYPSACTESWRRARKPHWCCACAEQIRRGDRYHYTSGIWDGRAHSFKHCARCWAVYQAIIAECDPGELVELDLGCGRDWDEAFDEPPPDDVAALAFMTPDEGQRLAPEAGR